MRVSVVVPTCGRNDLLDRCLAALVAQAFEPEAYEVIVVDDGDSTETERLVAEWRGRAGAGPAGAPRLRYVPLRNADGPAAARNAGWRAACGNIIAFTDDDCIPAADWLRAGVAAFRNGVVGASGRIVMPLPATPTDYELNAANLRDAEFATANCFYRRETIAEAGGFDENFTDAWREDSDLFFNVLQQADATESLVRAPDAVVGHPIRPAPWGVSVSQQRKNLFNALLYKKYPTLYRERIQASPPWRYYRIVGALLAALFGLVIRHRRVACVGAGAWAVMAARFCVERLHDTSRAPAHIVEMIVTSVLIPPLAVFWRLRGALKFRVFFL